MNQLISDTQQSIQQSIQDRKEAFRSFMQMKLSNLSSHGQITLTEHSIHLNLAPSFALNVFSFLGEDGTPPPVMLQEVSYNFNSSMLTIVTRGYGSQTIIPNVLQFENTHLSFTVNIQNATTLVVNFMGDWVIDTNLTTMSLQAVYYHHSGITSFEVEFPTLTINLQTLTNDVVGISLPSAVSGSLSISNFIMSGSISHDIRLYITATIGSTHVYIIYQKDTDDAPKTAVAVEISNIRFSSIIQDATGLDVTGIPYFGSVSVNIGLTIATTHITNFPGDLFPSQSLLREMGNRIEENVTAVVLFGFSRVPIKLCFCGGFLSFQPVIPGGISINDLLSAIPNVNIASIPLPPGINGFPQLRIDNFTFDLQLQRILINIDYPNSLNFFDGLLTVDDLLPTLNISTLGVQLDFLGDLSISGIDFTTVISLNVGLNKYLLTASADVLPITNLISQLQLEVLPPELNSMLNSLPFFSFSINDASLSYCLSPSTRQIQLAGTPVINGYSTIHMAAVVLRQGTKTLLVQGFELGSVNLISFLQNTTAFNFNNFVFLNQDIEIALLISPVSLPNVRLTGNRLSRFSITKGVSIQATMQFPSECSSDPFCAVAQSLLGSDAQLNMQGTIASSTSFTLFAGVSNINLGSGIVMSQVGVEIQAGTQNRVGIVGAVDLSNPDITLAARVALSTSGVVLEMTMNGCWENAFGASWLDICSLQSSVAMIPGVSLTGLALGGEVRIGDSACTAPITAAGFVGIDIITPTQNYYYVNIQGSTTFRTILNAFCININIPAPLAQSGFPRGYISSYSIAGVELPHVPLSIPLGFRLSGTLNILGLEGSADVTIGLPNGIDLSVALPPINVGGELLQMFESTSNRSLGPSLTAYIDLLPIPTVNIQARGYLCVLGICVNTSLIITDTQYLFNIQGNMLGLFEANLLIAAPHGNIEASTFRVRGSFTNSLYSTIENEISSVLQGAAIEASEAFNTAQARLNCSMDALNHANNELERGRDEVHQAQSAFDDARNEVTTLKNRLDNICSIRSCGTGN